MSKPTPNLKAARYVYIPQHWRRLKPIYHSTTAERIWRPCMIEYATWRGEDRNYKVSDQDLARYAKFEFPSRYDCCDWRCNRKGRPAAFWQFVCHSACHWLVDLNLFVACSAWPQLPWRILTARKHSTVWDGDFKKPLLFDANFLGLRVNPDEALSLAWPGRKLKPGNYLKGYLHKGGA